MKQGGFIVNGRPYQFFSREHAILNRILKGNGITRRGGVWNSFQSSNKGGRTAKRYSRGSWRKKGGRHHNKWVKYVPKRRKNPGERVKATTICLVIYHTIFDYSDGGNMSRRPFVWLFITRFLIRIGTCQSDPLFSYR